MYSLGIKHRPPYQKRVDTRILHDLFTFKNYAETTREVHGTWYNSHKNQTRVIRFSGFKFCTNKKTASDSRAQLHSTRCNISKSQALSMRPLRHPNKWQRDKSTVHVHQSPPKSMLGHTLMLPFLIKICNNLVKDSDIYYFCLHCSGYNYIVKYIILFLDAVHYFHFLLFMTKQEGDVSEVGVIDFSISILILNWGHDITHPRVDMLPPAIIQ